MRFSQKFSYVLIMAAMTMLMATTAFADNNLPGKGKTVQPAACTWNTGFFQAGVVMKGLRQLGYEVKSPRTLTNPMFYQAVAMGDVDFWANGWFPNHDNQLPKGFSKKADKVGYLVKGGAMQGYLASKEAVEKFNITSLEDFKRDDVKKAFDRNGDGKADLVACPPGWGCEVIVTHHMEAYGLKDHVNVIKAVYAASIADALASYRADNSPVLFYTWTPNWTVGKFVPGKDVLWINVPELKPTGSQVNNEEFMTVEGVKGAVTNPLKLGFVMSDLRVVANKKFLSDNPAAKRFFEVANIPLADINAQNSRMFEGEDSAKDIQRHVEEWIEANQDKWNQWLEAARSAQ